MQFLNKDNLNITFESLETSKLGVSINNILKSEQAKKKISALKIPTKIKLGNSKNNSKSNSNNSSFNNSIDTNKKSNDTQNIKIDLCQQFLSKIHKIMGKRKKDNRKAYKRKLSFRDETKNSNDKLNDEIIFDMRDPVKKISYDMDYYRRMKMEPETIWYKPYSYVYLSVFIILYHVIIIAMHFINIVIEMDPISNSNDEIIQVGPIETNESKKEDARQEDELDETCFEGESLDEPKILKQQKVYCDELPRKPKTVVVELEDEMDTHSPTPTLPPPLNGHEQFPGQPYPYHSNSNSNNSSLNSSHNSSHNSSTNNNMNTQRMRPPHMSVQYNQHHRIQHPNMPPPPPPTHMQPPRHLSQNNMMPYRRSQHQQQPPPYHQNNNSNNMRWNNIPPNQYSNNNPNNMSHHNGNMMPGYNNFGPPHKKFRNNDGNSVNNHQMQHPFVISNNQNTLMRNNNNDSRMKKVYNDYFIIVK